MAYDKKDVVLEGSEALHVFETNYSKIYDSTDIVALRHHREHSASINQDTESSVIFKELYFPRYLRFLPEI